MIKIAMQLADGASAPRQGTFKSAGHDLAAYETLIIKAGESTRVKTGLRVQIPDGYAGLILERSSLSSKGLSLSNKVGLIDSDYRGEILLALTNIGYDDILITKGDRLAQLVIIAVPDVVFLDMGAISEKTARSGGFGSTGV